MLRPLCIRLAAAFATFVFVACTTTEPKFGGPLRARSQHPAQLTVLAMPPVDVGTRAGGVKAHLTSAYSSLWLAGNGNGNSFRMDGEYLRSAVGARWGLTDSLEVSFEIPVAHTTGGSLDEAIVDWHDTFGFPNHGRDSEQQDQFAVRAERLGTIAFEVEERSLEWLDVPLALAWTVVPPTPQRPFALAVRGAIELPTGDEDRGFGNGGVDVALGVAAEYRAEWGAVTAHASHTFAETPRRARAAGLDFRDVTRAGVGVEIPLWDGTHGLLAVDAETSTLRELGFSRVADEQVGLWAGLRSELGDATRLELAIGEDLAEFIAPDVTLWLGLHHAFGAAADGSWHD